MKQHTKISGIAAIALAAMTTAALANGQFENRPWQFDTANDKLAKAGLVDLQERKEGGYYDGFGTTVNNSITNNTTVMGDQINCDLTASAIGNSGANAIDGSAGSPVGVADGVISSQTTGNISDSLLDTTDALGGTGGTGSLASDQSNNNSPLNSSVEGSQIVVDIGTQSSEGTNNLDLASNQTNTETTLDAQVLNSTACSLPGNSAGASGGS